MLDLENANTKLEQLKFLIQQDNVIRNKIVWKQLSKAFMIACLWCGLDDWVLIDFGVDTHTQKNARSSSVAHATSLKVELY